MKFLVLDLLGIYKALVSPFLPPACRFEPSCSEYAKEAVEKYGAVRGTWMGLKRILRCQPFCKGGYDPVKQVAGRRQSEKSCNDRP
ncbi:MAG: membrane protein insertion efficiency factor YidD [Pyrinomonadaceae bacterium]